MEYRLERIRGAPPLSSSSALESSNESNDSLALLWDQPAVARVCPNMLVSTKLGVEIIK